MATSRNAGNILESYEIDTLMTLVEEATRSTEEGVKYFVEPAGGSLRRAISRRHHLLFGRRGSGKSSLLRKAAADLTVARAPIAWVDLEPFKGHSYPDLLLSVLLATFQSFKKWLDIAAITPANKTSFWKRLFGKAPTNAAHNRKSCEARSKKFGNHIAELETQLHSHDDAALKLKTTLLTEETEKTKLNTKLKAPYAELGGSTSASDSKKSGTESLEEYKRSKIDFLRRHIIEYQSLFDAVAEVAGSDSFLFLDDLYHLRKDHQPQVVDYLHSIAKGHKLWLKFGTIRHRTQWYVHGNPPIGMKLSDDADEIDLDLTLEKYALTKRFLEKILDNLSETVNVRVNQFLTEGALDRLVLASGGVARDFLAILRLSVNVAREREADKINAEDINIASGEYDTPKRDEFKRDTYSEEEHSLDSVFQDVRKFCLGSANSNCFLLNKEVKGSVVDFIHELVDLKLLHLVRSRVTVNSRGGQIYEAYMLDLSQYAGSRKRRGLDIVEFWKQDSEQKLRKVSLIYKETDDLKNS